MAKAVICDLCKKVFGSQADETGTGHWSRVELESGGKDIRLVWGAFELRTEAEKAAGRGGKYLDICSDCVGVLVSPKTE